MRGFLVQNNLLSSHLIYISMLAYHRSSVPLKMIFFAIVAVVVSIVHLCFGQQKSHTRPKPRNFNVEMKKERYTDIELVCKTFQTSQPIRSAIKSRELGLSFMFGLRGRSP